MSKSGEPYLRAEVEALKAQLEAQRWIPVGERLPEIEDDVLVFDGTVNIGSFDSDGRWYDFEMMSISGVTHWRPLPAPPEVSP